MHTSDSEWDNVTPGVWYGEVIVVPVNEAGEEIGDTDYFYAYSSITEYAPDVDRITTDGYKILERKLLLTAHGKWLLRNDRWAFEEQESIDGTQGYDHYWDSGLLPE